MFAALIAAAVFLCLVTKNGYNQTSADKLEVYNPQRTNYPAITNTGNHTGNSEITDRPSNDFHDPKAADKWGTTIDAIIANFETIGTGSRRSALLSSLLSELGKNTAMPKELIAEFLLYLDANNYPEDSFIVFSRGGDIVRRLGITDSIALLGKLKSQSIKSNLATTLSIEYVEAGKIPSEGELSNLDVKTQLSFYSQYGKQVAEKMTSAAEVAEYLNSLEPENPLHSEIIQSMLKLEDYSVEPEVFLEYYSSHKNQKAANYLFEIGISNYIDKDLLKASEYLVNNKNNLDEKLYIQGVNKIIAELKIKREYESAKAWEESIKNMSDHTK